METAYGYVPDSAPIPFTVDGSKDAVIMAQKGTITVTKTGEV